MNSNRQNRISAAAANDGDGAAHSGEGFLFNESNSDFQAEQLSPVEHAVPYDFESSRNVSAEMEQEAQGGMLASPHSVRPQPLRQFPFGSQIPGRQQNHVLASPVSGAAQPIPQFPVMRENSQVSAENPFGSQRSGGQRRDGSPPPLPAPLRIPQYREPVNPVGIVHQPQQQEDGDEMEESEQDRAIAELLVPDLSHTELEVLARKIRPDWLRKVAKDQLLLPNGNDHKLVIAHDSFMAKKWNFIQQFNQKTNKVQCKAIVWVEFERFRMEVFGHLRMLCALDPKRDEQVHTLPSDQAPAQWYATWMRTRHTGKYMAWSHTFQSVGSRKRFEEEVIGEFNRVVEENAWVFLYEVWAEIINNIDTPRGTQQLQDAMKDRGDFAELNMREQEEAVENKAAELRAIRDKSHWQTIRDSNVRKAILNPIVEADNPAGIVWLDTQSYANKTQLKITLRVNHARFMRYGMTQKVEGGNIDRDKHSRMLTRERDEEAAGVILNDDE